LDLPRDVPTILADPDQLHPIVVKLVTNAVHAITEPRGTIFVTAGFGRPPPGLGLSIVHAIAAGHDGFVTAESAPGAGALFIVYLPAAPVGVGAL
jgi:signal transduction histidine kinase